MVQKRTDNSKRAGSVPGWIWIPALGFTGLLLAFFLVVFVLFPTLSPDRRELLHILIAFTGGFAALFMGGTVVLHLDTPKQDFGKLGLSATGGIALFLFLYLKPPFWYTNAPVPSVLSEQATIPQTVTDNSDLSVSIDDPKQAVPLVHGPKRYENERLFCEAVQTGLIVSHNQKGDRPIRLKRLSLESEEIPLRTEQLRDLDYQVDALHLEAHGIVELREYMFALKPTGAEGRYFTSLKTRDSVRVSPENILQSTKGAEAVTISKSGEDAHFQIVVALQAQAPGLYHARFGADYDVAGEEKTLKTAWLYIYKKK
jgi:hypothetical protein